MIAEFLIPPGRLFSSGPQVSRHSIPHSAATSASYAGRKEFLEEPGLRVPGEGWVSWIEIAKQFDAGSRHFWQKRAGKKTAA